MRFLGRLLAILLAFSASALPQAVAEVAGVEDCADEGTDCNDCQDACVCCPARVLHASVTLAPSRNQSPTKTIELPSLEPVLGSASPDIFHPPRC